MQFFYIALLCKLLCIYVVHGTGVEIMVRDPQSSVQTTRPPRLKYNT